MTDTAPVIHVRTEVSRAEFNHAFAAWLDLKPANTMRAYRIAWNQLFNFCGKTPREINRDDVSRWAESMSERGLSAATIAQRLAAISSFFNYLKDTRGFQFDNPASSKILRPKTRLYDGARYLTASDVRTLLSRINAGTVQGSRDYALILTYLFTGRRNSEIRCLQWGDIELDGFRVFYRWRGKGKARRDELPRPCFEAIQHHLRLAKRLETIRADEYIFRAVSRSTWHLPNSKNADENTPLSMHQVEDLLRKYCKRAGISSRLRVHDLRHTAAMLRRASGDDVMRISDFLGHSNLTITQVYLHQIEGREDTSWSSVAELLGISKRDDSHNQSVALKNVQRDRE